MNKTQNNDFTENVGAYFKDIKKYKLINKDKEVELGKRILDGDINAINELACANLKFVVDVAKLYKGKGVSFDELICQGNIGLLKAAEKFDYRKDIKFISYAVWWIKQYIFDAIKKEDRNVGDIIEYETSISITNSLDLESLNEVEDWTTYAKNEETPEYSDKKQQELTVKSLVEVLDEREKNIIVSFFGLNDRSEQISLTELSEKYEISIERIKQIKNKALRKMRSQYLYNIME